MIAVECFKCRGTAYTADTMSLNPCPYCGAMAIERTIRSLAEMDRGEEAGTSDKAPWAS